MPPDPQQMKEVDSFASSSPSDPLYYSESSDFRQSLLQLHLKTDQTSKPLDIAEDNGSSGDRGRRHRIRNSYKGSAAIKDCVRESLNETAAELLLLQGRHCPDPHDNPDLSDIFPESQRHDGYDYHNPNTAGVGTDDEVADAAIATTRTHEHHHRNHNASSAPVLNLWSSGNRSNTTFFIHNNSHSSILVRPNPVKTTPAAVVSEQVAVESSGHTKVVTTVAPPARETSWCQKATAASLLQQQQRQAGGKRRKEAARQLRRHQAQCAFPETAEDTGGCGVTMPANAVANAATTNSISRRSHNSNSAGVNSSLSDDAASQQLHSNHQLSSSSAAPNGAGKRTGQAPDDDDNNNNPRNTANGPIPTTTSTTTSTQPAPLFERLYTEEVQEIKAYVRIIEGQERRLLELGRSHRDLEARLEGQVSNRRELEATLEERERMWNRRHEILVRERDEYMAQVEREKANNNLLAKTVKRTEQDIHRMLQRKYDQGGGGGGTAAASSTTGRAASAARSRAPDHHHPATNTRGGGNGSSSTNSRDRRLGGASTGTSADHTSTTYSNHQNPRKLLDQKGMKEQAQIRNAKGLVLDFFGL